MLKFKNLFIIFLILLEKYKVYTVPLCSVELAVYVPTLIQNDRPYINIDV